MMRMWAMYLGLLLGGALPAWAAEPVPSATSFFEAKVRPLLVRHCYQCHSSQTKQRGELLLDSKAGWEKGGASGPAIIPGHPDRSLLIAAVRYADLQMPPNKQLEPGDIAILEQWVKIGAPDPRKESVTAAKRVMDIEAGRKHWAFILPRRPAVPMVKNTAWPQSDIDRFVLARLEAEGLEPVEAADRQSLARRVTFDLTGLPPHPEEMAAFVEDTLPTPQALEKLVDRLLDSPRFGEHWGRRWLDVARYADDAEDSLFGSAWRYRDYVIEAFNHDKPYNRFVMEQIAGDLLPAPDPRGRDELIVASGFLALGPQNDRIIEDSVDDQIDVTTKALLGLTVACARCHDHKFEPIPTTDYYALAGIFRSVDVRRPATNHPNAPRPLSGCQASDVKRFLDAKKTFTRSANEVRKPALAVQKAEQALAAAERSSAGQPKLAALRAELAAAGKQLEPVMARHNAARDELLRGQSLGMAVSIEEKKEPGDHEVYLRGDPKNKGPKVPRGFVTVACTSGQAAIAAPQGSGRLELAQWLASRDNPLTARVFVNRIWHHLFGAGLVRTTSNFGVTGEAPTHPELLDHLTVTFMADNWSMKRLIRRIVLSSAYQLSTQRNLRAEQVDPEDRLLWRMRRRRLDAEAVRDALLSFGGCLEPRPAVPSPFAEPLVTRESKLDFDQACRSVYLPVLRHQEYKGGSRFDCVEIFNGADPNAVVGARDQSVLPSQALFLLNSPLVMTMAERAARRLLGFGEMPDTERIDLAFRLALGRPSGTRDAARAQRFLEEVREAASGDRGLMHDPALEAWTRFCQALMASAEFQFLN